LNIEETSFYLIPFPVSIIDVLILLDYLIYFQFILTNPYLVNFLALPTKLIIILFNLF